MKNSVKKLPQSLINQIAAGEVIERPASIVKELLDNAIDADSAHIRIKLENGGINLIEISDNGTGVSKEDLITIFEPHTTSKLTNLEDLSKIMTMGFRGEALSTILSIAKVSIASKYQESEFAYNQEFKDSAPVETKKTAKEQGTTITIKDIFYNVPARRKFLKTPETEYRKILDTLIPYFLIYPNIHFELFKDGKQTYNLPKINDNSDLHDQRIMSVLKGQFAKELISIESAGSGIKISGYIAHPKYNVDKGRSQYIFVNKRPVWDNGISRSVHQGFSRYMPHGQKIPFIINIDIQPQLIDVNIHPRKEEIKFENPYRVYSLVEETVIKALNVNIKSSSFDSSAPSQNYVSSPNNFKTESPKLFDSGKDIKFQKPSRDYRVSEGIEFSKNILEQTSNMKEEANQSLTGEFTNVFQLFNKYIVIENESSATIIDQHAAAERITFERLMSNFENTTPDIQKMLVPVHVSLDEGEESFIKEYTKELESLGFELELTDKGINVNAIPIELIKANIEVIIQEIVSLKESENDFRTDLEKFKSDLLATIACHSSVRAGQKLEKEEMISMYKQLSECKNQYSCPHGRPIIWNLPLTEIDTHFYRTY